MSGIADFIQKLIVQVFRFPATLGVLASFLPAASSNRQDFNSNPDGEEDPTLKIDIGF
jgi:hypothetical protein